MLDRKSSVPDPETCQLVQHAFSALHQLRTPNPIPPNSKASDADYDCGNDDGDGFHIPAAPPLFT